MFQKQVIRQLEDSFNRDKTLFVVSLQHLYCLFKIKSQLLRLQDTIKTFFYVLECLKDSF